MHKTTKHEYNNGSFTSKLFKVLKGKEKVVGRGSTAINKAKGVYSPPAPELHISPCLSSQAMPTAVRSGPSSVLELNPTWQGQDRSLEEPRVFPKAEEEV